MRNYKYLFFDLDNTLWDFRTNSTEAFADVFLKLGLTGRIKDFSLFIEVYERYNEQLWSDYRKGKINKDVMRTDRLMRTFLELGINDEEMVKKTNELYIKTAPTKTHLFPGVHETLGYLAGKYNLYILTNGFSEVQLQKISSCRLQPYFKKIFMAEMVGYQKPDRRFFEYAIKSVHARKNECLIIGDDPETDIHGGANAGIDQVYFNLHNRACRVVPTMEIKEIKELCGIL